MRDEVRPLAPWMNKTIRLQKPTCRKNLQDLGTAWMRGSALSRKSSRVTRWERGDDSEQQEKMEREAPRSPGAGLFRGTSTDPLLLQVRMENVSGHPSVLQPQHNVAFAINGWSCLGSHL